MGEATIHFQDLGTLRPCFTPVCFMPFCFNAPYQFTPLPNLCPLIFSLMLSGWFISILTLLPCENIIFYLSLFNLCPLFFLGTWLGHNTRPWCILKLYCGWVQNSRSEIGKYNKLEYQILTLACIQEGILVATKMTFLEHMIQQHRISCAYSVHFDKWNAATSISKDI